MSFITNENIGTFPHWRTNGTFAHTETMANALWKLFLSKPYDWMKISQKMKLNILISNL